MVGRLSLILQIFRLNIDANIKTDFKFPIIEPIKISLSFVKVIINSLNLLLN